MALAETTLSSAVTTLDTSIVVASATSIAAGRLILVDQEVMQATKDYVSGTTVNVTRGLNGTAQTAHPSGARVTHGVASDFSDPAPGQSVNFPIAGRSRVIKSYSAAGAITLPTPGNDMLAVLNGTTVLAMTIAAPTKDMDGCELMIISNGIAAHTLTFAGGLSGAGAGYTVITINAAGVAGTRVIACNEVWVSLFGPAMGGTATNLIGSIA